MAVVKDQKKIKKSPEVGGERFPAPASITGHADIYERREP